MNKVNTLKLSDPGYPQILSSYADAPSQLFWIGASPSSWLGRPKVAIVGSRKVSAYGREITSKFASRLASSGCVIISGLAYGVDSIAHQAALDAGAITIAILPTSLDNIYPSAHANLAKQIIKSGGTLISEYAAGSTPYKANFTARNRIISGLSDIVLITEAALRSGTATTARFGLSQGKTVAAIPGNITSLNSQGTNNLIKSGALAVTEPEDILFTLNIKPAELKRGSFRGSADEEIVLRLVRGGMHDQEELALAANLDGAAMAGALISLELAGQIRPAGGGQWLAV